MYKFEDLRRLEIEPTNTCQARCPQCLRTPADGSVNRTLKDELSLAVIKQQIPVEFWQQLTSINFQGSTGDALAYPDLVELIRYMKQHTQAQFSIHTNGGLGSRSTWQGLAEILDADDKVIFGIDGLADTNHLYRVAVDFATVVKNATTFITAGGTAHWQYITFKHNQHQVAEAEQLSKDLGFKSFYLRTSGRFTNTNYQDVYADGKVTHRIEPSDISFEQPIHFEHRLKSDIKTAKISCEAIHTKWVAIYADGTVWPCCHLMGWHQTHTHNISKLINRKLDDVIEDYTNISLHTHTLNEIINSPVFQTNYPTSVDSAQTIPVCVSHCRQQ